MKEYTLSTLLYLLIQYGSIISGVVFIVLVKLYASIFKNTKEIFLRGFVFIVVANQLFWLGIDCVLFLNERYFVGDKVLMMGLKGFTEELIIVVILFMSLPLLVTNRMLKFFQGNNILVTGYILLFSFIFYLADLAVKYFLLPKNSY